MDEGAYDIAFDASSASSTLLHSLISFLTFRSFDPSE